MFAFAFKQTKYFAQNFSKLGLKRLISTSYANNSKIHKGKFQPTLFESSSPDFRKEVTESKGKIFTLTHDKTGDGKIDIDDLSWKYLDGDGDFRSEEIKKLRDDADIIITNPPFNLAEEFVRKALPMTRKLVAVFARTQFMEGIGRYERLFKPNPPTIIAQFTERVPIVKGRLSATASTATSYAWFVWRTDQDNDQTKLVWIPPSRRIFEKNADYEKRVETPHSRPTSHAPQTDLFGKIEGDN